LRVLRDRPDAWIDELQDGTSEPARSEPGEQRRTDSSLPRTHEPDPPLAQAVARTGEPERPLNRRERRALAALQRRRAA